MSRGVNKVILIGNLGQDPDTRYTPSGNAVVNLNLATDESSKDRNTGQMVPKYLQKGSKVYVEGKLQTRKWQDKNGQDKYTTEVVVDINGEMRMLDGKPQGQPQGQYQQGRQQHQPQQQNPQQGQTQYQQNNPPPAGPGGPIDDFDDDIPFMPLHWMQGG